MTSSLQLGAPRCFLPLCARVRARVTAETCAACSATLPDFSRPALRFWDKFCAVSVWTDQEHSLWILLCDTHEVISGFGGLFLVFPHWSFSGLREFPDCSSSLSFCFHLFILNMAEEMLNFPFPDLYELENKIGRKTPQSLLMWMKDAAGYEDTKRSEGSFHFSSSLSEKLSELKQEMVKFLFVSFF